MAKFCQKSGVIGCIVPRTDMSMQEAENLVQSRCMRIGIFDPYLDDLGGGEKYMMMLATCLAKQHNVTVFWDNKRDVEAFQKRFGMQLEGIQIEKNIFAPQVNFFERARASKNFDAIIILSDGSFPLLFSKKLFLHIQQPIPQMQQLNLKNKLKLKRISAIFYNSHFTKHYNDPLFFGVKSTIIYPPV